MRSICEKVAQIFAKKGDLKNGVLEKEATQFHEKSSSFSIPKT